jgi:hypothetical protein
LSTTIRLTTWVDSSAQAEIASIVLSIRPSSLRAGITSSTSGAGRRDGKRLDPLGRDTNVSCTVNAPFIDSDGATTFGGANREDFNVAFDGLQLCAKDDLSRPDLSPD